MSFAPAHLDDGTPVPLHARAYTDARGRSWSFDGTTLDHEGRARFRHRPEGAPADGSADLLVRGRNLASEADLPAWAGLLERADEEIAAEAEADRIAEERRDASEAARLAARRAEIAAAERDRLSGIADVARAAADAADEAHDAALLAQIGAEEAAGEALAALATVEARHAPPAEEEEAGEDGPATGGGAVDDDPSEG